MANLQAGGGQTDGGWTLVVAYRDLTQPLRRLAIYDGLVRVGRSSSQEVTLGGFEVPSSPGLAPSARLGTVTYEGDLGVGGDDLYLDGRRLSDAENPLGNFFNSSISALGVRRSDKQPDWRGSRVGLMHDLGEGLTTTQDWRGQWGRTGVLTQRSHCAERADRAAGA